MPEYRDLYDAIRQGDVNAVSSICDEDPRSVNITDKVGQTPLHVAASLGKDQIVKVLLAKKAKREATDNKKQLPLHLAAAAGSDATVKELCKGAARTLVDKTDGTQTALHLAAAKGFANVIAELLKGEADPLKTKDGQTALLIAASAGSAGHLEAVKKLAKAKVKPVQPPAVPYLDMADHKGWTGLHYAVSNGNRQMADALKEAGANVKAQNSKDKTKNDSVLHLAARHWNKTAVDILLHLGAPKEELNNEMVTPLYIAVKLKKDDMAAVLLGNGKSVNSLPQSKSLLLRAAERGDTGVVKYFLSNGADATVKDPTDRTALHIAAIKGHAEIVKLILGINKVALDKKDKVERTPLYCAASTDHDEIAKLLYKAGAKVETGNPDAPTLLHVAAKEGDKKAGVILAELDPKQLVVPDKLKRLPIHVAAFEGKKEVLGVLLKKNELLESVVSHQWTPLGYAVFNLRKETAEALRARGASLEWKDQYDNTYLHTAVDEGKPDVVNLLIELGANRTAKNAAGLTPLYLAARKGLKDIASSLVDGLEKDETDSDGNTLLHQAAADGHDDAVKTLISLDWNVNKPNNKGQTPLHIAVEGEQGEIVNCLLGANAQVDIKDTTDLERTPLHIAAAGGGESIVGIVTALIEKKGNWDSDEDKQGWNPLHVASANPAEIAVDIVKMIVEKSVVTKDVTDRNLGQTALHIAAGEGKDDIVAFLLSTDYNKEAWDSRSMMPLHVAVEKGQEQCVDVLLNAPVNIDSEGENDQTALHIAATNGNRAIIIALLECEHKAADEEKEDRKGRTALYYAVKNGHAEVARRLADRLGNTDDFIDAVLDNAQQTNLNKMLGDEAEKGNLGAVKLLFEVGADVNSTNSRPNSDCTHWTSLHFAAGNGHVDVVEYLLSKGANKDAYDCYNYTPVGYAKANNQTEVLECFANLNL